MDVPTPRPTRSAGDGPARPRVVVGVDGSDGSRAALRSALAAAARWGADLEVVAAHPPVPWLWEPALDSPSLAAELAELQDRADAFWTSVQAEVPEADGVRVRVVTASGGPADVLLRAAEGADLLVVGSRGRGAVRSTLLGSVALHCAASAPCPVVVVHPGEPRAGQPVLAGVDAGPTSEAVLTAALDEAARRGVRLDVVTAYAGEDPWADAAAAEPSSAEVVDRVRARLHEAVDRVRREAAGRLGDRVPEVRTEVVVDAPVHALEERSRSAQLVVVGSSGSGARRGLALGSVALHTVVRVGCPVLVVHPAQVPAPAHAGS